MSLTIRHATIQDMPGVLEIVNHEILHTTSIWDYDERTLEEQEKIFKEKQEKEFPFIVGIDNGRVVAFGTYGPFRFKQGYKFTVEHSLYVHKDFIGNGFGAIILKGLIALAKGQKLHSMIGVIDAENEGSIYFHEKLGFVKNGHLEETGYKFGRWLDSVFMQLILE